MKRLVLVGLSLCAALLLLTTLLAGYQHQAAAQTADDPEVEVEAETVVITPVRLDGQVVLAVTVRVGEDVTVTAPITIDVASWIMNLEGATELTATVDIGLTDTVVSPAITETLTTTLDVTVTGVVSPVLSLVEPVEEVEDEEAAEEETGEVVTIQRGEVLLGANLREGPGTDTAIIGSAEPGDIVVIVDVTEAGDWYNLEGGEWIAAFLVELLEPETIPAPGVEAGEEDIDDAEMADEEEAAEEEVGDPTPTPVAVLFPTPRPTATPTPQPAPTATPQPEEEPAADDAAETSAPANGDLLFRYRVAVITNLLNLATGVESMGLLMEDPQLLSASWNDSVRLQAAIIRGSYEELAALTPPVVSAPFHADLLGALTDCDVAMQLLTAGLASLDMAAVDQAADLLVQCGEKMANVVESYPEFLE